MTWNVPREWTADVCFILAGGASLARFDGEQIRGLGRVIGIKESGLTLAPWADVLWWCDPAWLDANHDRLGLHTGRYQLTRTDPRIRCGKTSQADARRIQKTIETADIKIVPMNRSAALSMTSDAGVSGVCSGGSAINLAALFGAKTIVLLGYDMQPTGHWHEHQLREPPNDYARRFIPAIERMAEPLRAAGIRVINATPGSALNCFETASLEEILAMNFEPHVRQIFQLRGRLSTFTPDGDSGVSCRAIRQGGGEPMKIGPVRIVVDRTCFHVRRAEVAAPAAGDALSFGGDDYTIDAVQPVERDAERQMWSLECSWGTTVLYRSVTGSGYTQSPPNGSGFAVNADVSSGESSITISAAYAVGKLVVGDTFTIADDDTVYTLTADVTAASNKFSNVQFSPALAADAAEDAAIEFTFAREISVRAAVAGYDAREILGGIQSADRRIVILQSNLDAAGLPDAPKAGDTVELDDRTYRVVHASAVYQGGAAVAWDIQARA